MLQLIVYVLPFLCCGLLIAAGAHYVIACVIGAFILFCVVEALA